MPSAAIEACELTKFYAQKPAIQNVSFSIQPGTVTGFLGPNGAGKSTTIKILAGLLPATSGTASVCGASVARYPQKLYKNLGYLPENNPLPFDLTVLEYLKHRAQLKGIHSKQMASVIQKTLDHTDLEAHGHTYIGTLSKGLRQRVGVAEALLAEPKILILDEPTVGLDPHQLLKFRQWIATLRGQMTVLISSHLLSEIEVLCDYLMIIHHGRIIAIGSHAELRERLIKKSTYLLKFQSPPYAIEAHLAQFFGDSPFEVKALGATDYELAFPTHMTLAASPHLLLSHLSQSQEFQLSGFIPIAPTLEDIFLAATQF